MRQTLIVLATLIVVTGLILFFVSRDQSDPDSAKTARPDAPSTSPATPAGVPPSSPAQSTAVVPPNAPASGSSTEPGKWVPKPDPRVGRTEDGKTILNQPAEMSRELHSSETDTEQDIEILDQLLWYYRKVYAQNPVVENEAAVTRALMGENPKNIVFIDPSQSDIGANGALLDRFGNPYYFHAISETQMDIVSAGPDGKRGTQDDFHLDRNAGAELMLNESAE